MRWSGRFGGPSLDTASYSNVIVSMTTWGARTRSVHIALESILRGREKPARLFLWLDPTEGARRSLPEELLKLEDRGLELCFFDEDWGPANKLVHTLRSHPTASIVTADDDVVYPRSWLRRLVVVQSGRSPDCVTGHECIWLSLEPDEGCGHRISPYGEMRRAGSRGGDLPSASLFAVGSSGVLYPPGSLHESVFDRDSYMSLSANNDDVWFKAMSLKAGVMTRRVGFENCWPHKTIDGSQSDALWLKNVDSGCTDSALQSVFSHYSLFAMIDDAR